MKRDMINEAGKYMGEGPSHEAPVLTGDLSSEVQDQLSNVVKAVFFEIASPEVVEKVAPEDIMAAVTKVFQDEIDYVLQYGFDQLPDKN